MGSEERPALELDDAEVLRVSGADIARFRLWRVLLTVRRPDDEAVLGALDAHLAVAAGRRIGRVIGVQPAASLVVDPHTPWECEGGCPDFHVLEEVLVLESLGQGRLLTASSEHWFTFLLDFWDAR